MNAAMPTPSSDHLSPKAAPLPIRPALILWFIVILVCLEAMALEERGMAFEALCNERDLVPSRATLGCRRNFAARRRIGIQHLLAVGSA